MYERKIRILQEDVETEKTENNGEEEQLRQELEEAKQEIEQLKAAATAQDQDTEKEGIVVAVEERLNAEHEMEIAAMQRQFDAEKKALKKELDDEQVKSHGYEKAIKLQEQRHKQKWHQNSHRCHENRYTIRHNSGYCFFVFIASADPIRTDLEKSKVHNATNNPSND